MINTQILINNIKTDMEGVSWTSPSSGGTTSFVSVFDFPNWLNEQGFPFLVILDRPIAANPELQSIQDVTRGFNIDLHICANYPDVTGTTEADRRNEAMLRVREAYDFLTEYIAKDSNIQAWQSTPDSILRDGESLIWRQDGIEFSDGNIDELNLYRRTISLPLRDIITTR